MRFDVLVSEIALNALNALPRDVRARIKEGLEVLEVDPWLKRAEADIRRLKKIKGYWRLRIGKYRAIFSIENPSREVKVVAIIHRKKEEEVIASLRGKL